MKVTGYLFISSGGSLRVNKTGSGGRANDLRLQLVIDVPDAFFRRPAGKVEIIIPPENVIEDVALRLEVPLKEAGDFIMKMPAMRDGAEGDGDL